MRWVAGAEERGLCWGAWTCMCALCAQLLMQGIFAHLHLVLAVKVPAGVPLAHAGR